ncbi:MAG: 16S rRNA (cytosine(967)-C(5))-methyltransferase RsmB [Betaproteobacteria bacterium]|nr:16S rRNA (cytosine(967)-C(5))-methyltransferase RsmB [Betaproteobacteria bacterium]MDE2623046.1 16S rRNA (cytosine(967)-C(5))-methyltransferase RsmB [Betaproteobacteria bacterium]
MQEIQRLATLALAQVLNGRNLDHALTDARKQAKGRLTDHQRASMQDAAYGVLRYRSEIEGVLLQLYPKRHPLPPLDALLMVATYQLLHTRSAHHAVVSHAVETAAEMGSPSSKGFVNGVLRNLLRQKDGLLQQVHETPEGRFSHPGWWIEKVRLQYPERWESLLEAAQQHAPMTLRVNRRHNSRDQYQQRLSQAGMAAIPVGSDGLVLEQPVSVAQLPGFDQGDVSVQDASAQFAAELLALHPKQRVLDACAAPGGKTAHILERGNGLEVWALDQDAGRVRKMEATLSRLKVQAHCQVADASQPDGWWDGVPFDRILLDAPCSGSGVVRRHPDIKWLRRPEDIPALAETQTRLLDALWPLLRRGGRLIYATCSIFAEENRMQADAFLERHPDAKPLPIEDPLFEEGQILPDAMHDGFFYAIFRKV